MNDEFENWKSQIVTSIQVTLTLCFLKIFDGFSMAARILNLAPRTLAYIAAYVNNENAVSHVNLALVHVVQHFLGAFRPDFIVTKTSIKIKMQA